MNQGGRGQVYIAGCGGRVLTEWITQRQDVFEVTTKCATLLHRSLHARATFLTAHRLVDGTTSPHGTDQVEGIDERRAPCMRFLK